MAETLWPADGVFFGGFPPSDVLDAYDEWTFKITPISDTKIVASWIQESYFYDQANPSNKNSHRAQVFTAGDVPTPGPAFDILVHPDPQWGSTGEATFWYAWGFRTIAENRILFVNAGDDGLDGPESLTYLVFDLLEVDPTTDVISRVDRQVLSMPRGPGGPNGWWPNTYEEFVDVVQTAPGKAAVFYSEKSTEAQTWLGYYRMVDATSGSLVIGEKVYVPDLHQPDGGAWCNGEVGVVMNLADYTAFPFTVNDGGNSITVTKATTTGWQYPENPYSGTNDGTIGDGPAPNQFVLSSYNAPEDAGSDYLCVAVMETDGTNAWVVDQSLPYNEDAGFGYPNAWLPATSTTDGKVAAVYGNATRWDTPQRPDPIGRHGHYHYGRSVILFDMMAATTYDDAIEWERPDTGVWAFLDPQWGASNRGILATASGVWIVNSSGWAEPGLGAGHRILRPTPLPADPAAFAPAVADGSDASWVTGASPPSAVGKVTLPSRDDDGTWTVTVRYKVSAGRVPPFTVSVISDRFPEQQQPAPQSPTAPASGNVEEWTATFTGFLYGGPPFTVNLDVTGWDASDQIFDWWVDFDAPAFYPEVFAIGWIPLTPEPDVLAVPGDGRRAFVG